MIRSASLLTPAVLCALGLFAGSAALAQRPVFTGSVVHPLGTPTEAAVSAPAAVRPVDRRPVIRGRTPRTHADEMADVFQRACLDGKGEPDAAADWALNHGFVAASDRTQHQAVEGLDKGESSNVFSRESDERSVLLMSTGYPFKCAVLGRRAVDGARLRVHVERMAAAWVGAKAPAPVVDMRILQGEPLKAARMLGYKFSAGPRVHTLMAAMPEKAGEGVAFLTLMIDDAARAPAAPADDASGAR